MKVAHKVTQRRCESGFSRDETTPAADAGALPLTAMEGRFTTPEDEGPPWERAAAALRRRSNLRRCGILRGILAARGRSHSVAARLSRQTSTAGCFASATG